MDPTRENTCAIVVTYHPDSDLPERLQRVRGQVAALVLIDNGSGPETCRILREFSRDLAIDLIENSDNPGLAAALNQGVDRARELGYDWALTLDQDTVVAEDLVAQLGQVHRRCPQKPALIGSNYWNIHKNRVFLRCSRPAVRRGYVARTTVISSGTLLNLAVAARLGPFRSDYVIDSVDHEYSLRARRHGYPVVMSCQVLMSHTVGEDTAYPGWIKDMSVFNHPPARKYYMARNALTTARDYCFQEPLWSCRQLLRLLGELLSIVGVEDRKTEKLRAFLCGIAHAMTGRMGLFSTPVSKEI